MTDWVTHCCTSQRLHLSTYTVFRLFYQIYVKPLSVVILKVVGEYIDWIFVSFLSDFIEVPNKKITWSITKLYKTRYPVKILLCNCAV